MTGQTRIHFPSVENADKGMRLLLCSVERGDVQDNGCWRWKKQIKDNGYGVLHWIIEGEKKKLHAHRFSYVLFKGEIPDELEIDHLCRNRWCVNPEHLEAVCREVNIRRGVSPAAKRAAQTLCKRGHSLSGDNLYRRTKWRTCLTCQSLHNRKLI